MTTDETPPTNPPPIEPLLTIAQAAEILQTSKGRLYVWSSRNINPELFVRLRAEPGARPMVRVDPERLRSYMLANRGTAVR